MDFGLSSEQVLLKDTLRRFLSERCPTTRVRSVMESGGHDPDLWRGLAELGVAGLQIPTDHGGAGLELLDVALAAEELGYAATPGPFLANAMAVVALLAGDNETARTRWLPEIAAGDAIGAVAIGEAHGEWRADRLAARVENGLLSGDKPLVHGASAASFLVVAARDDAGPGIFLAPLDHAGVERQPLKVVDMTRPVDAVRFRDVPVQRLGDRVALQRTIDAGCVLVAASAYGGARRSFEMAVDYAKQREQFGRTIGAFQAVKHQLADLVTELEPSLSLWWYAAHAFDHITDQSERHAALAKAHLSDVFDRTARVTTELHGGIGFTWEFDLQLWFRRALFDRAYLGDARYHRARAAELAGW